MDSDFLRLLGLSLTCNVADDSLWLDDLSTNEKPSSREVTVAQVQRQFVSCENAIVCFLF